MLWGPTIFRFRFLTVLTKFRTGDVKNKTKNLSITEISIYPCYRTLFVAIIPSTGRKYCRPTLNLTFECHKKSINTAVGAIRTYAVDRPISVVAWVRGGGGGDGRWKKAITSIVYGLRRLIWRTQVRLGDSVHRKLETGIRRLKSV